MAVDVDRLSGHRARPAFERLRLCVRALEGGGAPQGSRLALGVPTIDAALTPPGSKMPAGGGVIGQSSAAGLALGCLHELTGPSGDGAALAFGLWLAGRIAGRDGQQGGQGAGMVLWVGCGAAPYPPGLVEFGLDPARLVHIRPRKPADIAWVLEEAARTGAAPVVIGDLGFGQAGFGQAAAGGKQALTLTASRRLQLACEPFGVTLLLLSAGRHQAAGSAAVSRWNIESLPSRILSRPTAEARRLGLGQPAWRLELIRARGGRPGTWPVLWQGAHKGLALATRIPRVPDHPMDAIGPGLRHLTGPNGSTKGAANAA